MTIAMRDSETPDVLDHFQANGYSPYLFFDSEEWAHFRADTPLTLTADEVHRLRSIDDPIDLDEVRRIYLSLSRLLSSHVEASQLLFEQRNRFLNMGDVNKTPFVIGIAGSVAVGKSTTARILKELLARWPSSPTARSCSWGNSPPWPVWAAIEWRGRIRTGRSTRALIQAPVPTATCTPWRFRQMGTF